MNIKEIRNEYKKMRRFNQLAGGELVDYLDSIWAQMEDLYTHGYVTDCTTDFMAIANGYVVNTQDYDHFHILQTLGMRDIEGVSKRTARDFMIYWLHL